MKNHIFSYFCILALMFMPMAATAQGVTVNTYAGGGALGQNGGGFANGPRLSARFMYVQDLAYDSHGNMYVADGDNRVIRKITPAGVVSVYAGRVGVASIVDGPPGVGSFWGPSGLAFDSADNLYVIDASGFVRKVTPSGFISTLAGSGTVNNISDYYINGPGLQAKFWMISDLTVGPDGNIYVADYGNNAIRKITPAGVVSTFAGAPPPPLPYAMGDSGHVDATGTNARFNGPKDVAFDKAGNLYVAEWGGNFIRKITPGGVVTTFAGTGVAGTTDGPINSAKFWGAYGVVFDSAGNLYVIEYGNVSTIRKITPAGIVSTFAGSTGAGYVDGPAASAKFNWPTDAIIDLAGTLYVADYYNHRVRSIAQDAGLLKICKVAGAGVSVGGHYHFTVSVAGWPSQGVDVIAGAAPGGYCTIGPRIAPGTTVTVTEQAVANTNVVGISGAPAARLVASHPSSRSATLLVGAGVTEVTFTNARAVVNGSNGSIREMAALAPDSETGAKSNLGYIEVCKTGNGPGTFNIGELSKALPNGFPVPAGTCGPAMPVPAGTISLSELPSATLQMAACSTYPADRLVNCDLATGQISVTVPAGDVSNETILTVNNVRKAVVIHGGNK